ncbi:hydrolase [Mucilaginibacter hurinus]|uniref:Hydrolase n=1 Tax=Mucilaginibacter hurinus TaxID=2201324 RepID=A0A367GK33_9SPHI|nr:glycoside hydrolase family 76 protein [Mucilaginibacter hurinus]RCH53837.1 hydrolase [Mucilaginibacter hurinus]
MSFSDKTLKLWACFALIFATSVQVCPAQTKANAKIYQQRADTFYDKIWHSYRAPAYGLFTENFGAGKADSLTYFQGAGVEQKEVSYLWPFSGMFSATNVMLKMPGLRQKHLAYLDSLVTGVEQYRDTTRKPPGYQAYPARFEKVDRYYDDNGLVGIDYAEAYLNTKNPVYLSRAKEVFTFILSGWDEKLGGGVTWLEGHRDQKPACSNGMAALTALKIYQANRDSYYLEWGQKFYNWMYDNLRDPAGVYWNDKKMDGSVLKTQWTYNSGSMLEASVLLYQFTKNKKYLAEAQAIAAGTLNHFSGQKRSKHLDLHIDLPWFVTVLFRGYEALYHVDGNYKYIAAVENSLNYAWTHARDKHGLITKSWTPDKAELQKPKWLLDEACIAELYARLSLINTKKEK